ncbi:MAG TPA: hypothetical protein VK594_13885, partial [Streptosporangiaceae bacterium]|nr:hypothetical protein [Streptosporangiaceae bacterium]
ARDAKEGVWASDATTSGATITAAADLTDQLVTLPKLFRRLAEYFALSPGSVRELERLVHRLGAVRGRRVVSLQGVDRVQPQLRGSAGAKMSVNVQAGKSGRIVREEMYRVTVRLTVHDPVLALDQIKRHLPPPSPMR